MAIVSGTPVKSGTYFNSTRFTFAQVQDGESLKGGAGDRWVRVPLPLAQKAAACLRALDEFEPAGMRGRAPLHRRRTAA